MDPPGPPEGRRPDSKLLSSPCDLSLPPPLLGALSRSPREVTSGSPSPSPSTSSWLLGVRDRLSPGVQSVERVRTEAGARPAWEESVRAGGAGASRCEGAISAPASPGRAARHPVVTGPRAAQGSGQMGAGMVDPKQDNMEDEQVSVMGGGVPTPRLWLRPCRSWGWAHADFYK